MGTTFLVGILIGNQGNVNYAVTCRHVIEGIHERGYSNPAIRLNLKNQAGLYHHPFRYEDWVCNKASDVAVLRVDLPAQADYWAYPMNEKYDGRYDYMSLAQDLFFVGLFQALPGENSVDALVRSGKVARVHAKVSIEVNPVTRETVEIDAHIAESRSWGGESGSPVYAYEQKYKFQGSYQSAAFRDPFGDAPQGEVVPDIQPDLVGIMHGHYQIPSEVTHEGETIGDVEINSGVAVVIPIQHLRTLLVEDRLVRERERIQKQRGAQALKRGVPKPDSAFPGMVEPEFTKEDFEAALKKVSRKIQPSQSDEGKSKT